MPDSSLYVPPFNVMDPDENRSDEDRAGVAAGLAGDGRGPGGLVAP